jgi:hypothetical protein
VYAAPTVVGAVLANPVTSTTITVYLIGKTIEVTTGLKLPFEPIDPLVLGPEVVSTVGDLINKAIETITPIVQSFDPNAKFGPIGYSPSHFVSSSGVLPYRVDFENDPTATAPAQQVIVTDQLSPDLDWSTFRLTEFGFGNNNITVPTGLQHYETSVPMTYNGQTFNVLIDLGINLVTGLFTAEFQSINPATDLPPDLLTGFLPPEDGTGRGMGYVGYIVDAMANLPTGTQITNVALVTFDDNPPVATDQVSDEDPTQGVDPSKQDLVTIDSVPPTSSVAPLPAVETSTTFTLNWSGKDDPSGSGIASYNIYVSVDGGPSALLIQNTTNTSAAVTVQPGDTYAFYSQAIDNVGNVESAHLTADATTSIPADILTGTSGPDTFALKLDPDGQHVDVTLNGGPQVQIPVIDPNGLTLIDTGSKNTINLDYSNGNPLPDTLHLNGTFTIAGLQGANPLAGRMLDIGKSTVYLSYSSPTNDPIFAIRPYLQAGYNNGAWNGTATATTGVITSAAAQGNANHNTAIGYADWADGQGVNTTPNTIELKYTLVGDANLDGQVNSADLQILLFGLNRPGAWDQGDFNYDGNVNSADLQSLLFTLNTSLGNQATPAGVASVAAGSTPTVPVASHLSPRRGIPTVSITPAEPIAGHPHPKKLSHTKRR